MNVGAAVAALSFDTLTVERSTRTWVNGVLVTTLIDPQPSPVACSAQPITGKDLERVPEAQRSQGALIVFSLVRLYVGEGSNMSDSVTFRGDKYTVVHSEQWDVNGYWRSVLVKAEV